MSLISDALKRQEQLRSAPGAGAKRSAAAAAAQPEVAVAAQPEVAAAAPPEVAAARPPEVAVAAQPEVAVATPPEVAAARPPEVAVAAPPEVAAAAQPEVAVATPPETSRGAASPNLAASAAQPRAASPRPASPPQGAQPRAAQPRRQRPNLAPAGGPTSRGTTAPNPFLERERAAARRSNPSVLLMPILGIIVLVVLLFLRREFVPGEEVEVEPQYAPRKVEETPAEPVVLLGKDGAHGVSAAPDAASAGRMPALPGEDASAGRMPALPGDGGETSNSLSASASSAALREKSAPPQPPQPPQPLQPSNRQTVKSSNPSAEAVPQPTTWPAFTLTGIAVGRERLAILNTGEMLLAGETSKCGVKVEKVNASTVVFAWGGETKTLRKGEQSDKPAD